MRCSGRSIGWLIASLVLGVLACSAGAGPVDAAGEAGVDAGPTLRSVSVSPAMATLVVGARTQLAASLAFGDGATRAASVGEVSWTSSDPDVAAVDTTGAVEARRVGRVTITAGVGVLQGFAIVSVSAARTLTGVRVTPATATLACGMSQQLSALALYSDGSSAALSAGVTWVSSAPGVASVDAGGLARAVATGRAEVTASSGGLTSEAAVVTVSCAPMMLAVSPARLTLMAGDATAAGLHAEAVYADGTRTDVTELASWTSSAPGIVSVSETPGTRGQVTASPMQTGSADVVAEFMGVRAAPSVVSVVPSSTLRSITLTPPTASVCGGATQAFSAFGTYADGRVVDVTSVATWSSSAPSVATVVASTGVATAAAPGTATITARVDAVSGAASLSVFSDTITRLEVSPAAANLTPWTTVAFSVTAFFSCGSSRVLTTGVSWSTSDARIATINTSGVASGVSTGTVSIIASVGTVRGTATVGVTTPVIRSISVTPADPTVPIAGMQQLSARATHSDGSVEDVTRSATWTSAMPGVVSVSSTGLLTGVCNGGPVSVSASAGGITGSTSVTVGGIALARIVVAPTPASVGVGLTQQFIATGFYTEGRTRDLTNDPALVWSSSDPAVAAVSNATGSRGVVTALGVGTAEIHADWTGAMVSDCGMAFTSSSAVLTVTAP